MNKDDSVVRLGLMPPLTGIVGLYGEEISWAGAIATEIVNERGGVLGRSVQLVVEDDGSVPESAIPAAERLLGRHGCVALIGNLLSSSRIAVASQVAARKRAAASQLFILRGKHLGAVLLPLRRTPNQQIVNGLVRHELGGEASWQSEPHGVQWQFSIPFAGSSTWGRASDLGNATADDGAGVVARK